MCERSLRGNPSAPPLTSVDSCCCRGRSNAGDDKPQGPMGLARRCAGQWSDSQQGHHEVPANRMLCLPHARRSQQPGTSRGAAVVAQDPRPPSDAAGRAFWPPIDAGTTGDERRKRGERELKPSPSPFTIAIVAFGIRHWHRQDNEKATQLQPSRLGKPRDGVCLTPRIKTICCSMIQVSRAQS